MKECGFCGTELPADAQFCTTCGNKFDLSSTDETYLVGAPEWGEVRIAKMDPQSGPGLLQQLQEVWASLEKVGQLGLFMGQASKPLSPHSVLYCPINSYVNLLKAFSGKESQIEFKYTPIEPAKIDAAIEAFYKTGRQ